MSRVLDAPVATALADKVVRPVVIVFLDILGDQLFGWNGPGVFAPVTTGDPELDGNLFLPSEGVVGLSDFVEDQGIGEALTIVMRADSETAPVLRQFVTSRDPWQGRQAKVWIGLLDEAEAAVVGDPFVMMDGIMTMATLRRSADIGSLFSIVLDADLQKASGFAARLTDHQRFYPMDTASTRLIRLAQGPITGAAPITGFGGGGSVGEGSFGFFR